MWTLVLCPKPNLFIFHAEACLEGDCLDCEINNFKICLKQLQSPKLIQWKNVGYKVVGHTNDGREKKA
jgi:hypothetical protein